MNAQGTFAAFAAFVSKAEPLVAATRERQLAQSRPKTESFRSFVEEATKCLTRQAVCHAQQLRNVAEIACRWRVEHDLVSVIGATSIENSYTRLIAWALDPSTHPPTALLRQQALLQHVGIENRINRPVLPQPWLATEDGIPDLVFAFDDFTLVIEAKTGTAEHATPSGRMQTYAYADAVLRRLQREARQVEVIFLTLDNAAAANPAARSASFFGVVLSLAEALERQQVPADLRVAFGIVLTHFVRHADLPQRDLFPALEDITRWESDPGRKIAAPCAGIDFGALFAIVRLLGWRA